MYQVFGRPYDNTRINTSSNYQYLSDLDQIHGQAKGVFRQEHGIIFLGLLHRSG